MQTRIPLALSLLVVGVYAVSALWMPADGFWIYDTALKFIQVRAIAEGGALALDWPGRALDPELAFGPLSRGFYGLRGDELHAAYSPVFPLLSSPFYRLFGLRGLGVIPMLGALLVFPAVWKLGGLVASESGTRQRVQVGAVLVVAFATPLWFYALAFWEHAPAVALACWAVFACVRYLEAPDRSAATRVGVLAALPIYFRPENYLFALVVLAFAAWPTRKRSGEAIAMGIGCGLALLPLWSLHTLYLGHPLGLHITSQPWSDVSFVQYLAERGQVANRLLFNLHETTALSLSLGAGFYFALLLGWRIPSTLLRTAVPIAGAFALVSGCVVLWGYLAAERPMNWMIAANGLFAVSPVLILAFLGAEEGVESSVVRARRTLLGIALVFVGIYTLFIPEVNSRGIHWGNRFFLCVYPLLAVLAVGTAITWWERFASLRLGVVVLAAALVLTTGLQFYGLALLHDRKAFVAELNQQVRTSNAEIVVTDIWFIPVDLAGVFFEKPIFLAPRARRATLLQHALQQGVTSVLAVDRPRGKQAPPDARRLSDGRLRFSPVLLREARVNPR
ncbi:MAG: hypothetical protein GY733_09210 [bacterium]|nr:hypothetical protein [bacterium]